MRLAQTTVIVNVVGDDKLGTFSTVEAAAYLLVHELDLKKYVDNTRNFNKLVETNKQLREIAKKLGEEVKRLRKDSARPTGGR